MILKRKVTVFFWADVIILRTMMKDTEEEVGQKESKMLMKAGQRVVKV